MGLDVLFENQLGHWQKFQRLHIHSLSTLRGQSWAYFISMGSGFWDTGRFSKLTCLGMELAIGQSPSNCTCTPFLTQGVEIAVFLLYGQLLPRYGPIFKIVIIGHETWQVSKVTDCLKLHIYPFSTPRGRNWAYFALRATVYEIRANFKFAIFGYETWQVAKVPEVPHILSFYQLGTRHWAYFCSTGSGVWDTCPFSKLPYLGMILGKWTKKLHIYSPSTPGGSKWSLFSV